MSEVYFGRSDLFGVFDRLQRQFSSLLGGFPTGIRAGQLGAFPSVNIGTTDDTIEIIAFAPDIHPAELEVSINSGLLPSAANTSEHRLRGTSCVPRPKSVSSGHSGLSSNCVDGRPRQGPRTLQHGCLTVSVGKREAPKPCAIAVQ